MPTDPREPVTVEIVPDPIPRALFESLITAFADVAADYGLTIGGRILGEAGTTRRTGGSAEVRRIRERFADQSETIAELRDELALAQKVAGAADHLIAGHEPEVDAHRTWLAHRFRTMVEQRTSELATALDRLDQVRGELTTTQHDHATAITRIRDLRAAATAAHQRADAAEAQVAAVREALDELAAEADKRRGYREIQAAERAGLIMAISRIREALDAAGTPESATDQPNSQVNGSADGPETAKPPADLIEACRQRLKDQHAAIMGDYSGDPTEEEPYQDAGKPWFWDEWAESWAAFVLAASTPGISAGISDAHESASTPADQPNPSETAFHLESAGPNATPLGTTVTDAMVQAAVNGALQRSGHLDQHVICDWCHLNSPYPRYAGPARERVFRAALEAALTPAAEPHTGHDCPNRIEVTSWGMTDREWICGCDPRPDATAPAETPSPSEAP